MGGGVGRDRESMSVTNSSFRNCSLRNLSTLSSVRLMKSEPLQYRSRKIFDTGEISYEVLGPVFDSKSSRRLRFGAQFQAAHPIHSINRLR